MVAAATPTATTASSKIACARTAHCCLELLLQHSVSMDETELVDEPGTWLFVMNLDNYASVLPFYFHLVC